MADISRKKQDMRLGKANYYADFIVYPLLVIGLSVVTLYPAGFWQRVDWLAACAGGVAVWTLLEYLLHRFAFHRIPVFVRMHDAHHRDPGGLVGTPTWLSVPIVGLAVLPLWRSAEFDMASGLTAGLMLGYLWYVAIHHVIHHWPLDRGSYVYGVKRRHARHHHARRPCNFGVTTSFWDRLFGSNAA